MMQSHVYSATPPESQGADNYRTIYLGIHIMLYNV